ncbi:3-oxoacyl-ACP synthase [Clostridia bacterium]|nr:3-oxoacyl-ACP synthase [Clostridia bacterium]
MLNVEIKGMGTALPKKYVEFRGGRRYRISGSESHIGLLCESAEKALTNSGMTMDDIDVIIGACAVGAQPIPCTAALIHERIAGDRTIPAFDVNATCTSFVTALDIAANYIQNGRYRNALIVSGDVASIALNENERHSFELFADGAVSAVISPSETSGILYVKQLTNSKGAHLTEIMGGGTSLPAFDYTLENKHLYQFHMLGKEVVALSITLLTELFANIDKNSICQLKDIDMIIPHQASSALKLIMRKLNVPTDKYIDITKEYGNMVSASVPFALDYAIHTERVKRGDIVFLLGSAAGLTVNAIVMKY